MTADRPALESLTLTVFDWPPAMVALPFPRTFFLFFFLAELALLLPDPSSSTLTLQGFVPGAESTGTLAFFPLTFTLPSPSEACR